MINLKFVNLYLPLLLTCYPAHAGTVAELSPDNFSHTASIAIDNPSALEVTAALPQWAYLASMHNLRDLRVFNAEGIAVAHQLLPRQQEVPSRDFSVDAVAIPFEAKVEDVLGRNAEVKVDIAGKVDIHLSEQPNAAKTTPKTKVNQWVIDEPNLAATTLTAFRFEIADAGTADFTADLSIETSEDLRSWRTLVSQQKILNYGKQRLTLLNIKVPPTQARYWRVKTDAEDISRLAKIHVTAAPQLQEIKERLTVDCQLNANRDKVICPLKDLALSVTGINFDFDKQRVAFNARIDSYDKLPLFEESQSKATPLPVQAIQQMLTSGQSAEIALSGSKIAAVVLSAQQGGKLAIAHPPKLTITWPAQKVKFLVNGGSPFVLAVGAAGLDNNAEQLIAQTGEASNSVISQPTIKEPTLFTKKEDKQRPWLLWSMLGLAVVSLGWMAASLLKQN